MHFIREYRKYSTWTHDTCAQQSRKSIEDESKQTLSNPLQQKPVRLCLLTPLWNESSSRFRPSPVLPSVIPPVFTPLPTAAPRLIRIVVAKCDAQVANFKMVKEEFQRRFIPTWDHCLEHKLVMRPKIFRARPKKIMILRSITIITKLFVAPCLRWVPAPIILPVSEDSTIQQFCVTSRVLENVRRTHFFTGST